MAEAWSTRRPELEDASKRIIESLREAGTGPVGDGTTLPKTEIFTQAEKQLASIFDSRYGGFGPAPKFPHPGAIQLLLRIHRRTGNSDALTIATTTLDRMARGGIYDHIGGGFARYSTDAAWRVPHFEKMLYDNAQLTAAYLEGYQATGNEMFADVARETLDYILREMTSADGGFYSAQDAGDVGKEGEFYVWKAAEIDNTLSADQRLQLKQMFNVTTPGNFEHGNNILSMEPDADWEKRNREPILGARKKLFEVRSKRTPPHKDDKVLVSWNGLTISAFARGYQVLGDEKYLKAAQKSASFIKNNLFKDGQLLRRYRDGESKIAAVIDDYAFLIQGLLDLYESDFDQQWLAFAQDLQAQQDKLLWRADQHGYAYTSGADKTVMDQPVSYSDGAEPSGNGISISNLFRLSKITGDRVIEKQGIAITSQALSPDSIHPLGFSSSLIGLDFQIGPTPEIAIATAGPGDTDAFRQKFAKLFIPNRVLAAGKPAGFDQSAAPLLLRGKQLIDGKTTYYVCQNHTCREPLTDLDRALGLILTESGAPQSKAKN